MRRDWRRVHRSPRSSLSELNITPLLDLVFVLLVIFIIATPQLMNSLSLSLPSDNASRRSAQPEMNTINVGSQGQIKFNGEQMTLAQLQQALTQLKRTQPGASFLVDGASDADYQRVVDVFALLHQFEFTKVGLVTDSE